MKKMQTIKLTDGREVLETDYIKAKTKDLIEFGYTKLTEAEVEEELRKIKTDNTDLTVIGMIMKSDIDLTN